MSTEGIALVSYILFLISGITALAVGSIAFFYSLEVNKNMKEGRKKVGRDDAVCSFYAFVFSCAASVMYKTYPWKRIFT
ncbi:hypothetical protein [Microbulbifer sp. PSTR4-B]|jgi:hypothetical protein|uniref:hypothetical protein n=1 Tax=unclassified Microbulbifer TaxID=2619833 RepID=UPI00403B1FA5